MDCSVVAIGERPRVAMGDVLKVEQFCNKPRKRGCPGYQQLIEYPELLMTSLFRSIAVPDVDLSQPIDRNATSPPRLIWPTLKTGARSSGFLASLAQPRARVRRKQIGIKGEAKN